MTFATSFSTTREPETEAGGEGKDEEAGGRGASPEGPEKWLQWEE